jgi:hypothetical protein
MPSFKTNPLIAPILIIIAVFMLPRFDVSYDPNTILSAATFIFSILTGFFLADATANYRALREIILTENATLINLYQITKRENPKTAPRLAAAIDEYIIAQLDYELLDHYENTKDEFDKIIDITPGMNASDRLLASLIPGRQKIFLLAKRTVSKDCWLMILSLVLVITYLLLAKRTGAPSLSLLIGVLIASIHQALRLLHELDSNKYLARQLGYQTPQDVFRSIGRLPYYPEIAIMGGLEPEKPYRKGVYTNYPDSFEKRIETIE